MVEKKIMNNTPESNLLWKGLGGNFDSLVQILNEFIDNSFSNFIANDQLLIKKIFVRIEQISDEKYRISVEDTGAGVANLSDAFSIGNQSQKTSSLNEHGFGMKHALSAANKENDSWKVLTRTENNKNDKVYTVIQAPFNIINQEYDIISDSELPWPGTLPTGTIVEFDVGPHWINTINRGLQGNFQTLISRINILKEELGYTYSNFIKDSIASVAIQYKQLGCDYFTTIEVGAIEPEEVDTISPGKGNTVVDLGNGDVNLSYEFLQVVKATNLKKYYQANMSTSGVEIRVNGRLLANNLFTEIWGIEKHNSYNYIMIRLNIKSQDSQRLPSTTTNKAGLRQDDEKLDSLYRWLKSKLPQPKKKESLSDHETDLFEQLRDKKIRMLSPYDAALIVDNERYAFTSLNEKIRIDLYQSFLRKNTIYEGKKDKTTPQDVYQLIMYWDGLVMDKIPVDEAILIATEHPESVRALVTLKNDSKDQNGKNYKIIMRTWQDEDINYPN